LKPRRFFQSWAIWLQDTLYQGGSWNACPFAQCIPNEMDMPVSRVRQRLQRLTEVFSF
jgi:hypothetical protein